jgi:hypothetical protein
MPIRPEAGIGPRIIVGATPALVSYLLGCGNVQSIFGFTPA